MHFVRFEDSMMTKQAAKSELKNVNILLKPWNFEMDFFGAETNLCMDFTALKNVII